MHAPGQVACRPFRIRHFLLLAAVLLTGLVVVIMVRQNHEPVWEPASQYVFRGRVSGLGWVSAFVSLDGQTATVELNTDDGCFIAELGGEFVNGQITAQEVAWTGENTSRPVRTLEAALSDSPLSLQGTLTETATGQTRTLELQPVARYWTLSEKKGLQVFNRGWGMTASASIPEFIEPTELDAQTVDWLKEEARAVMDGVVAGVKPGWREQLRHFRFPAATGQWVFHTTWHVESRSPNLISLRGDSRDYTGGAHGNYSTTSQTWWRQEGDVLGVELRDLFREHSGWETNLQAAIGRNLARQKLQRGVEGVTAENIHAEIHLAGAFAPFTVNPHGIAFYFDPYVAGSFAEGRYRVFLPFTELESYLRTDGPMADLRPAPVKDGRR